MTNTLDFCVANTPSLKITSGRNRYKLTIEYDGTPFAGWQRQKDEMSVQQAIEEAIARLCKEPVTSMAAGRTDAGVHALGQVLHFELSQLLSIEKFINSINYFLRPYPIVVLDCELVDKNFHARFSAKSRSYVYRILNRSAPSVLQKNQIWHVVKPLDSEAMHEAAQILMGKHDFSSFRSAHCQSASPVKNITQISVTRHGEIIEIYINAPSFLHNQVRIITGCLKSVGEGVWDVEKLRSVLECRDRREAAATAPSRGLFFLRAEYYS